MEDADRIYGMQRHHVECALKLGGVGKAELLAHDGIEDPFCGPIEEFRATSRVLDTAIRGRLPELAGVP